MADLNTTESSLLVSVVGADANGAETTPLVVNPDGSINVVLFGGPNIKVSSDDQTLGFLEQKVVGTPNKIEVTTINPGADEDLKINIGSDVFDKSVDDASDVTNIPSGNISATTVQAAINELDAEKQPLDATLTALAAYNTNGLLTQTAPNTFVGRTIEGTVGNINVLQGDGVAANPRIDLADIGTPGSLGDSNKTLIISVDEKGRVNGLVETPILIPSTQVSDFTEAVQDVIGNAISDSISIDFNYNDAGNTITASVIPSAIDHNQLANLDVGDVHTQYVHINGRAGGQAIEGGTGASENLILDSTTNATKGNIILNPSGGFVAVGTQSPISELAVTSTRSVSNRGITTLQYSNDLNGGKVILGKARGTPTTPLYPINGDIIGLNNFKAWDEATSSWANVGFYNVNASENHTASAKGTNIGFWTTSNGTTTPTEKVSITNTGRVVLTNAITLSNTAETVAGTYRWTGTEAEVSNGTEWKVLGLNATSITATSSVTTTSATYSIITSMQTTPAAGTYLLSFNCNASIGNDTSGDIAVFVGGTEQTIFTRRVAIDAAGFIGAVASMETVFSTISFITVNGSQQVDIRFRENGGGTLGVSERVLTLIPAARPF